MMRERTVRHHVEEILSGGEDERSRFCLHRKESKTRYKIIQ